VERAAARPHGLTLRAAARAAGAVLLRPRLWRTAVVEVRRLAPNGWWRRRPYLPVPDAAYLRFRMQTQYGDADHEPKPEDLVAWLEWCRRFAANARQ
jgi:hypothetical protein